MRRPPPRSTRAYTLFPYTTLCRSKRVVVCSLRGAFTPTCTTEQCPAFERFYEDFKAAGVDEVYCVSVNDAFVMYQWGKHLGIKHVKLLPDGSGDSTRRMGMLIKKHHLGFGERSWRYAMVADRKSTRLNSRHYCASRMPSSA